MAKSKSFNAAEDLLFGTSANRAKEAEKANEVAPAAPIKEVASEENEKNKAKEISEEANKPVGDKLFFIHKEPKSVRKNWLITPSNDRDLRAEAESLGTSVNELINLIFEQRYGRTRG